MPTVLIIDDDITFCLMLKTLLAKNGYDVTTVFSPVEAKQIIEDKRFDIVFTDLRMPKISGMELIRLIKEKAPASQIIMMTGYADISTAIESIKRGAYTYIPKPLNPDEVLSVIKEALKSGQNTSATEKKKPEGLNVYLEGISTPSQQLSQYIELVSPTPMSVLIEGESGTGKEYVARLIHKKSKRSKKQFVAVDCGVISNELAASEFFGHVKGSFTGAISDKIGHFETANNGTLFLDEVGNLSGSIQIQLLRALQERRIKPVGSNKEIAVDVRLIAATNENLQDAQLKGRFREDLYHRLNEFQIVVPPLRERPGDIMLFADYFLKQANKYLDKSVAGFEKKVEAVFMTYPWPGNLREMQNIVKRATLLCSTPRITLNEIPTGLYEQGHDNSQFALNNELHERKNILRALKAVNYNKTKAARLLKIDRKTLYNKLKQLHITLPGKDNP